MRRPFILLAVFIVACGGLLPFTGDDEEPPEPAPSTTSADASDDGQADASDGANGEAAVGQDGGFPCLPAGICADDESECCSGKTVRQTGCTQKCEIACCIP